MKFKTGILLDNLKLPLDDSLRKATELGVDGVQFYASDHHMSSLGINFINPKLLKQQISDYELEISAICGDLGGHAFQIEEENSNKIDATKRVIDFASELGTDIVTTHIGVLSETDLDRNRVISDALIPMCQYAKQAGIYIAIETGPEKSSVLKSFIDEIGESHLKVNFDPANLVMIHGEDPVTAVDNLKDYIIHTHIKDGKFFKQCDPFEIYSAFALNNPKGIDIDSYFTETPLGGGDINFKCYLEALNKIGYSGYLTRESEGNSDRIKDITDGIAYINKLI